MHFLWLNTGRNLLSINAIGEKMIRIEVAIIPLFGRIIFSYFAEQHSTPISVEHKCRGDEGKRRREHKHAPHFSRKQRHVIQSDICQASENVANQFG